MLRTLLTSCRGLLVLSIAATCCWIAAGQDWPSYSYSSSSSDISGVVRDLPCLDERGKIVLHGYPYWIDECSNCVCDNGTLLCQYKSCQPLPCSQSERINLIGVCCDICPNNDIVNVGAPTVSPDTSKKQDSVVSDLPCLYRGRIFRHGEVAQIDDCINCVCHNSTMSCQFLTCPPLTCRDRIDIEGVCCDVCPNNDIVKEGAPPVSPDTSKKQASTTPVPEDVDGDDKINEIPPPPDSPLQPLLHSILVGGRAQLKFERDNLAETRETNNQLANLISIKETRV